MTRGTSIDFTDDSEDTDEGAVGIVVLMLWPSQLSTPILSM
jgi:hypothetical protein